MYNLIPDLEGNNEYENDNEIIEEDFDDEERKILLRNIKYCITPLPTFTDKFANIYEDQDNRRLYHPRKFLTEYRNGQATNRLETEDYIWMDVWVRAASRKAFETGDGEIKSRLPRPQEWVIFVNRNVREDDADTIRRFTGFVEEVHQGIARRKPNSTEEIYINGREQTFGLILVRVVKDGAMPGRSLIWPPTFPKHKRYKPL